MDKLKIILPVILCLVLIFTLGFGKVQTDSMEPAINAGSIIIYTRIINSIDVGDIVLFKDGAGRIICHRVLSIEGEMIITKGDNLPDADRPITKSEIIGKYLFDF